MSKKVVLLLTIILLLILSACAKDEEVPATQAPPEPVATAETPQESQPPAVEGTEAETDEPEAEPGDELGVASEGVFFSELVPGIPGGNNDEFIELYNAGAQAVDLNGFSLWYLLADGQQETLIYGWDSPTDIPPFGHYLLVRTGKDFGVVPDATFVPALFEQKGGLILRDAGDELVDALGWGAAPEAFKSGQAAAPPKNGASLERLPGGDRGNGVNSGDNTVDFMANASPNPQNSGSPTTPTLGGGLAVLLTAPESVPPGSELTYQLTVENQTGGSVAEVQVFVPIPALFSVLSLPEGAAEMDGRIVWTVGELADGAATSTPLALSSPFTYVDLLVSGYYAETASGDRYYGPISPMSVAGGSIPIGTARELFGSQVTIEGTVTMYTGGFFAGTTGTKFYVEDETGGVQVYIPGGMGLVNTDIGDRVRVTGEIELYRDSVEIIPVDVPGDVELVETGAEEPIPTLITILDNERDPAVIGRLNVVEGMVTRVEELTYQFEIDLIDDQGNTTLVFIEKDTGVTAEPVEVGQLYQMTGISEFYSTVKQIKPRVQSDLSQIFPSILLLEMTANNSILPGEELAYTITAYNHTSEPLTSLQIVAKPPTTGVSLGEILDDGQVEGDSIIWTIDQLPGGGESVQLHYTMTVNDGAPDSINAEPVTATAVEWPDPVSSSPYLTFVGTGVPIWAIQGDGFKTPYALSEATTVGVVTGIFPELEGFWIQETESDFDPATSAGLYVFTGEMDIPVAAGDLVQISGRVRELSSQTTLQVLDPEGILILSSENPLPAPAIYDPPRETEDSLSYSESLEGMLVILDEPAVVIGPTTRYGEYVLLLESWGIDMVRRIEEKGFFITVDDGSAATHDTQENLAYAVQRGDIVTNLTGPLAYTYGAFKVQPLSVPDVLHDERSLPALDPVGSNELSVATFNVENLFDLFDPHPAGRPDPTPAEYRLKLSKVAEAIVAMGAPAIIGLQEVENIDVLEDLVEQEQIASYDYQPLLDDSAPSGDIFVAYLVRGDLATIEGYGAYPDPEGFLSRPTLVVTATIHLESGDVTVYALNNHFSSLASGEEATEPRRTAQAAWNVTLAQRILAEDPEAHIFVMGDLNSFYRTRPLDTLQDGGLHHAYEFFESDDDLPYTYIFQGGTQSLDHILFTEDLFGRLVQVEALHIDTDYPVTSLEDGSARRVSDHDPVVVVFDFE